VQIPSQRRNSKSGECVIKRVVLGNEDDRKEYRVWDPVGKK
jgi:hypothetical protein